MSTTNGNGLPPGLHRGQQHLSHPTLPIGGGKYVATAADGKQVLNRAFIDALATLTDNAMTARREWLTKLGDPRRDIDDECGYAKELTVSDFKNMYDREPVAGRVVEAIVKESWALPPTVYEDENEENVTAFEQAWDDLGKSISAAGGTSWHQDEEGSPVWEYLKRADTLSRIGRFGILFIGFDDGLDLSEPVPGSVEEAGSDTPGAETQREAPEPTKRVGLKPAKPDKPVTNAELEMLRKLPGLTEAETAVINRLEAEAGAVSNRISTPKELVDSGRDPYLWPTSSIGADAQYFGQYGGRSETVATKPAKQERKVLFLRAFGEDLVQIVRYEWNPTNPRFGQPVMYRVTFNDTQDGGLGQPLSTLFVHWSRVIHIADVEHHARSSEIFAAEAMRPVWNRLWNIRKTSGAAGEGYWRAGVPGLIVKTPSTMGGERPIIDGGEQSLKDDMEQYQNGFQRVLYLANLEAQTLTPSSVDPTPFIDADLTAIAMKLGMPKRVLMGSERGELASSQDDASWNDRVHARRTTYNQPRIIVPFIDRLILVGALPEPDFVAPVAPVPGDALTAALPPSEGETKAKEADAKAAGAPTDGAGGPAPTPGKLPSKTPVPTPKKGGGPPVANYDASQPRDKNGQWASGLSGGVFAFQNKRMGGLMTEITLKDENGKTAGMITIRPRPARDGGGNEIHEVRTMPGFTRKGVGTELYRRAYLVSKAAGKSLHTSQVISDDAKALHKSFREKGYLNGTELTFNGLVVNAAPAPPQPQTPPKAVKGAPPTPQDKAGAEPGDAAGQVGGDAQGASTQTKPVGYRIYWPDLDSTTDTDKANIAGTLTTAMAAYVSGGLDALIPPLDYLTKVCGFDVVEAKMMLAVAEAAAQQAAAEAQALADEHGLVPEIEGFRDPSEPPPVGPGGMVFEGDPRAKEGKDKKPVVNQLEEDDEEVENQFCPTGEGGGIDPTCGAGGGAATGGDGATGNPKNDNALGSAPGKDLKAGGGVRLVEHEGKKLVVKQRPNIGEVGPNEVMTSELARKAGVTMPAARMTTINGKPAQVQEFKEGTELAKMTKEEQRAAVRKVPRDQVDKNTMFDYLMGSSDVHNGNYLVDGKGNMVAVDKEFTLSKGIKGQKFHPPQFLDLASADGNGLNYRFDPKTIQTMVGKGEDIAKDLESRGMKAEARQVRDRVAVLNQLATDPNPTAGRLWTLGSQGVTPPGMGALGKLRWHLTKNSAEGDDNGQP